jgi:hypothetical protein
MADKKYTITVEGKQYTVTAPEDMSADEVRADFEQQQAGGGGGQPGDGVQRFDAMGNLIDSMGNLIDVGKQLASGIARGVESLPDTGASILGMLGRGAESLGLGDPELAKQREAFMAANKPFMASSLLPNPETTAGQYASSVGEFIPGVMAGPGRWLSKLLTALAGGIGAETAGQLASGTSAEPYARIVGGVTATLSPQALRLAGGRVRPEVREKAATLQREGVTALSAGERTGRPLVSELERRYASDQRLELPLEQFTNAAMTRVGMPVGRVNPRSLSAAYERISNQFDNLATHTHLDLADPAIADKFLNELVGAQTEFGHVLTKKSVRKAMFQHIDDALNMTNGTQYKSLRSRLERIRRGASDPEQALFLSAIVDAMDNAVEASLQKTAPNLVNSWQEVRNQYRNFLVIEKAYNPASEFIAPQNLLSAVAGQSKRNLVLGRGSFADLAHAGTIMRKPPSAIARETPVGPVHMLQQKLGGRALMSRPMQSILSGAVPFLPPHVPLRQTLLGTLPDIGGAEQPAPETQ